jgi:hypothetical protein
MAGYASKGNKNGKSLIITNVMLGKVGANRFMHCDGLSRRHQTQIYQNTIHLIPSDFQEKLLTPCNILFKYGGNRTMCLSV